MKLSFLDHKKRYKDFFEHPSGKFILHELMDKFYITNPTIRKGDSKEDYLVREGMRQVVLYIMAQVNYDVDTYLQNRQQYKTEVTND